MDWYNIWIEDKQSMMATMARNMAADLEAGYDYFGTCIQNQIKALNEYREEYYRELDKMAEMDPRRVNHYCYFKLLKSGAITA